MNLLILLTQSTSLHLHFFKKHIIILSSHLWLGLPRGLFSVNYSVETWRPSIMAGCPSHLILLYLTILSEQYKIWGTSLWSLLLSTFPFFLGQNIRLVIPFSNTLMLSSSLKVGNLVLQSYSTTEILYLFTLWHNSPWRALTAL